MPDITRMITLAEASTRTGIEASWLRRLVLDGRLPGTKIGKTWLVDERDVAAISRQSRPRGRPRLESKKPGRAARAGERKVGKG